MSIKKYYIQKDDGDPILSRKSRMARFTSSGFSAGARWPASGIAEAGENPFEETPSDRGTPGNDWVQSVPASEVVHHSPFRDN